MKAAKRLLLALLVSASISAFADKEKAGNNSHSEGYYTQAVGVGAHAEGYYTQATGDSAHSEGYYNQAQGVGAHVEGYHNYAEGSGTHAEGVNSAATNSYSFVYSGEYKFTQYLPNRDMWIGKNRFYVYRGKVYRCKKSGNYSGELGEPSWNEWFDLTDYQVYGSHGKGTFNTNPVGGADGFYIGHTNLTDLVRELAQVDTNVLNEAKSYTDTKVEASVGYTDQEVEIVKSFTTNEIAKAKQYSDQGVETAKSYTDTEIVKAKSDLYTDSTDYTDSKVDAVYASVYGDVELSPQAQSNGVSFACNSKSASGQVCGEEQNGAIQIGHNSRAAIPESTVAIFPTNTHARSVSIAIGEHADALVEDSTKSQALAIGYHAQAKASNAIAIGMGAEHSYESAKAGTGDATYASSAEAIAVGYGARATASKAVQIGKGENNTAQSFKFRDWEVLNSTGQVPVERLQDASEVLQTNMFALMERALRPGNLTVIHDGSDEETPDHIIEPRLNGLSEMTIVANSNGVYKAGTEVYIEPPLGSRNFDVVINEIPKATGVTNGVEYVLAPEDNFLLTFTELRDPREVILRIDNSIGFQSGTKTLCLTNAPCIVKLREPSTNKLYVVVKPWDLADL